MPTVRKLTNWRTWVRGIFGAIVGGGANAVTVMLVDPLGFNLDEGWPKLWHFTVISAAVSAALYLKQHPVPPEDTVPPFETPPET